MSFFFPTKAFRESNTWMWQGVALFILVAAGRPGLSSIFRKILVGASGYVVDPL
jgi:hypothetical protein